MVLVGVLYALGTDRGECQSGEKDSGMESHGEYLVIIGLGWGPGTELIIHQMGLNYEF